MSSPDPSRGPQETKAQREEKQKVEKVREVDPDEQAKQRRRDQFKMMMDDTVETSDVEDKIPSPYEPKFYSSSANTSSFPNVDDAAVAGPGTSPPPTVNASSSTSSVPSEDLPQSESFWGDVDMPDQPIQQPTFQQKAETPDQVEDKGQGAAAKGKKGSAPMAAPVDAKGKGSSGQANLKEGKKGVEPSPFGAPGKGAMRGGPASSKDRDEKAAPSGRYWAPDAELQTGGRAQGKPRKQEDEEEKTPFISSSQKERLEEEPSRASPKQFTEKESSDNSKDKPKKGHGATHNVEIVAPSTPALPSDIQPYAVAAATHASPYLSPEVLPLFYQMVGSIMIMTMPPGTSRTEITLNAPAFANSKFFGSTIEITKYSTAPDSLNIRLSGSNEAVKSFNDNIPSLMAAFQSGKFNFRIGRLEASYSTERPLFRRKGEKDEGFGGDSKGRG
jgi:hypothetical protein